MKHLSILLGSMDLRRTAAVLFGSIVVVGLIGALTLWLDPENAWFDLDSEIGLAWPPGDATLALPALWSAALLALAGTAWVTVGWMGTEARLRRTAAVLGAVLLFFAVDELFIVHERLEARSGIDWQTLYLPLAVAVAMLLAVIAYELRHRDRRIAWMLLGGGACWAIAVLLEQLQWRGDEQVGLYGLLMIPEELLELGGSSLLIMAALAALHVLPAAGEADIHARDPS